MSTRGLPAWYPGSGVWLKVEENPDRGGESCREEKREKFSGPATVAGQYFLEPDLIGSQEPVQ